MGLERKTFKVKNEFNTRYSNRHHDYRFTLWLCQSMRQILSLSTPCWSGLLDSLAISLNAHPAALGFGLLSRHGRRRQPCADSWHRLVVIYRYYPFYPISQTEGNRHYTTLSRIQVPTLPLKSEIVSKLINLKGS